ncbi:hypothetical protein Hanom_Chr03g00180861 [Helianthus anomalus]
MHYKKINKFYMYIIYYIKITWYICYFTCIFNKILKCSYFITIFILKKLLILSLSIAATQIASLDLYAT